MRIEVICFTAKGYELGKKVAGMFGGVAHLAVKSTHFKDAPEYLAEPLSEWCEAIWPAAGAIIFIGACGIAVRTIAPNVNDKFRDPAVIVMDEQEEYCISLLSGHAGGANDLVRQISARFGTEPVITTATDLNQCFAVDELAREEGLEIIDREAAKELSAALLVGQAVVTVGIGCRQGVPFWQIEERVLAVLRQTGLKISHVNKLASIDRKGEEPGLKEFAAVYRIPFITYSEQELSALKGTYTGSVFVRQITGVDNVCERAAVLGSGGGTLITRKDAAAGVTIALAVEDN